MKQCLCICGLLLAAWANAAQTLALPPAPGAGPNSLQEAQARNVKADDLEVQRTYDQMRGRHKDEQEWRAFLKSRSLDEEKLRTEIVTRLHAQGFGARAAIAPTPGAAWAFARYAKQTRASTLRESLEASLGASETWQAKLAALPVEALRLDPDAAALLRRLGLKNVGQLLRAPRSSFTARAGERAMLRLDQGSWARSVNAWPRLASVSPAFGWARGGRRWLNRSRDPGRPGERHGVLADSSADAQASAPRGAGSIVRKQMRQDATFRGSGSRSDS